MFSTFRGPSAAMILAAMMAGTQPAFPSSAPRLPAPPIIRDSTPRQKRVRERKAALRTEQRIAGFRHNDRKRRQRRERDAEFKALVNAMSNWQRNQWAKAGYPGLRDKSVDALRGWAPKRQAA